MELARARLQVMVTIISREKAQPRRLATRDYRQVVVCPGCEKFTVDNKMLADMTMPSEAIITVSIAAQLGL